MDITGKIQLNLKPKTIFVLDKNPKNTLATKKSIPSTSYSELISISDDDEPIIVKREPGLPNATSPSFDPSARNSHQMGQWRSMLLRMRTASKNLVEEKVPVFTDRVNKAKNTYLDYNPTKTTLDRYILEVSASLES